jgi:opacity protein-like surface antigen
VSNRKLAILLVLACIAAAPAWAKQPVFSKKIGKDTLIITGPKTFIWKGKKMFADKAKNYGVKLEYGSLKVTANQAAYDLDKGVIELSKGFKGSMDQYQLEGDYFRINPRTGGYAGYDLKFGYLGAYFYGREFKFQKNKIVVDKITVSPSQFPIFRLYTDKLEMYPGYSLASRTTLKLFTMPFYFIPLYIDEGRRSYFDLPFPAPEVKDDIFHGMHGGVHTHYFFNPSLYGDLALKQSEQDGVGFGIQQLVRLSDHHQLELGLLAWEKAAAQSNISYELHFFGNPRSPNKKLPFSKLQKQEEDIAAIEPALVFRSDYTANEEIQRSIVDRYPDASLTAYLRGILYDHKYTLTPAIHYGKIREKRIFPEVGAPLDVIREYTRTRGEINFSYYLETPRLKPFINKVLLGLDYEHSMYEPGNTNRGRVEGSLTVRRPIIKALGLYYDATLTKTLIDYNLSPFFFEEYGRLMDSGTLDLYLQADVLIAGNQLIYDFTNWEPYNEIYYLGVKAGSNYATLQWNRRFASWEFAFTHKEAAF